MNSKLLQRAGECLYGPRWQSELARDLDIADRTMRRWVADAPPATVYPELRSLLERRLKDIAAALSRLPSS